MTEWLGMPPLAAAHGGQIDNLIGWIHIFMLILFVGWGAFLLYVIARFRKSRNPVADYKGVTSDIQPKAPKLTLFFTLWRNAAESCGDCAIRSERAECAMDYRARAGAPPG